MLTRLIQRLAARLTGAATHESGPPDTARTEAPTTQRLRVKPGDLIATRDGQGWRAVKILEVDQWPDGSAAAHCLNYKPMAKQPTLESIAHAEVLIWHAPIDAGSFGEEGWTLIGNRPPVEGELVGFLEYLKLTNFPRYLETTGKDAKEIIHQAKVHYLRANELCEKGQRHEGIAEYSAAIDLFPPFFEAIDNRAFTHMELGNFREALGDFEQSLRVNPDGEAAFFSRGECLMRLGELETAEAVFEEGLTRFPEKTTLFMDLLKQARGRRAAKARNTR
ncbi:tetratricopeptide repeat protein [Variovorax sp. 38R]|uniref:tetratricopeptide repeat protein n=1 Tax=Variovorax sp. 38R TaxID=2774875 RepID=UPI00177CEE0A|nr:tetratricopeptide repeat protein [Variovorax sp. 38R]QOF81454.1 tetratricopeptide repeat protein [Variovorax sp. 38R]